MGIETPKQPTPEEQAKIEAERTLSDTELIKDGAEYVVDEETGEKRLKVTGYQTGRQLNELNLLNEMEKCTDHKSRVQSLLSSARRETEGEWFKNPDPKAQEEIRGVVTYQDDNGEILRAMNVELSELRLREVGTEDGKVWFIVGTKWLSGKDIPIDKVVNIHPFLSSLEL